MISLEKIKILTALQKLPNNVGNLGKLIVVTGFEKLPKVQLIAQSGHTVGETACLTADNTCSNTLLRKYFGGKLTYNLFNNFKGCFITFSKCT